MEQIFYKEGKVIYMKINADRIQRTLTAGVLREKLGDYPVVQKLTRGKADDYEFGTFNLIDREDYMACKLWCEEDVSNSLKKLGYKGTDEQVKKVLKKSSLKEDLEAATEDDWNLIESACDEAGFYRKENIQKAKELWGEFGDVPMNPETECIEVDWHGFPAGTKREEIWYWFEDEFNVSVAKDLMFE